MVSLNGKKRKSYSISDSDSDDDDFEGFTEDEIRQTEESLRAHNIEYDGFNSDDLANLQQVLGESLTDKEVNAWINVDENEPVSSRMTEDEITFSAQQEPQSELESDDEEPEPIPSMKAVVQCIETTLKWAESYENSAATAVFHLRNLLHHAKAEARKTCKQSKVTDFFNTS